MDKIVGECGNCGGDVVVPQIWMGSGRKTEGRGLIARLPGRPVCFVRDRSEPDPNHLRDREPLRVIQTLMLYPYLTPFHP